MKLKCPHCGHLGGGDKPHGAPLERTLEATAADGWDLERTSSWWFLCRACEEVSPFFSWKKESPNDSSGVNIVEDDGVTRLKIEDIRPMIFKDETITMLKP